MQSILDNRDGNSQSVAATAAQLKSEPMSECDTEDEVSAYICYCPPVSLV